jgi:hypothetical protein
MATLAGQNQQFPMSAVLAKLEQAGWEGPLRDFKLQVLERNGRPDVRDIRARVEDVPAGCVAVFRAFTGALNAPLDSLQGVLGIGPIKELKDFVSRSWPTPDVPRKRDCTTYSVARSCREAGSRNEPTVGKATRSQCRW